MKNALIGHTGFVGSNLMLQTTFTDLYNSKNIEEIRGREYDVVVCAGTPAAMWLANNHPEQDLANLQALADILKTVRAKHFVLISTIAVYQQPVAGFDESSLCFESQLAYGRHRRHLEVELASHFSHCHILRLPALFGANLKKNFIYDLMNQEPAFMPATKWAQITSQLTPEQLAVLTTYYKLNEQTQMHAFDKERAIADGARPAVLEVLKSVPFTSLAFTHAESLYQFYDLANLWHDINLAIASDISVLNICSVPVTPRQIAAEFFNMEFNNQTAAPPFDYDMHTQFAHLWGENTPYQYSQQQVFAQLKSLFASSIIIN